MIVKLANPENAPGMIDPFTRRRPFIDPQTGAVLDAVELPETIHWMRRVRAGELIRLDERQPDGTEPLHPLTTRRGS